MYDVGLTVTGPVITDKLWFVGTMKRTFLDQYRIGSYNPDGTQFVDDNKMVTYSGKLSYAMSSNSQLHYSYLYSNKQRFHRSGNSLTDFWESASTHLQELEGHVNQAKWTRTFSSKMVMDVSASNIKNFQPQVPQPEVQQGAIARYDSLRRTHTVAQEVYEISRDRRTVAHGSLNYFTGSHDVKAGFQWDNGRYFAENFSTSGMRAVYRNGAPDSVNTYNTPVSRDVVRAGHRGVRAGQMVRVAQTDAEPRPAHGEIPWLAARDVPGADAVRGRAVLCGPRGRAELARPVAAIRRDL